MTDRFDEALSYYEEGRALMKSGDVSGAIAKFEQSIVCVPHFKTLELLGEAFLKIGKPDRAVVPLAAATTLNRQVRAPSMLAEALLATGDRFKAHEIARLALERDASNLRARTVFEATADEYRAHNSE